MVPVVALLMSGCSITFLPEVTVSQPPEEVTPADVLTGEPVEPVWELPGVAVGQPTVVDGVVVVVMAARDDELDIIGIDAKYGDELWRFPYSPGSHGHERLQPLFTPSRDGKGHVVFQRAETGLDKKSGFRLPLVVVDPVSGDVVAESDPVAFDGVLRTCPDGHDACVRLETERAENGVRVPSRFLKFDIGNKELRETTSTSSDAPEGGFPLADGGLFWMPNSEDLADGSTIGRMGTGRDPLWQKAAHELLGDGYTPRFTHTFRFFGDEDEDGGHFVGGYSQGGPTEVDAYEDGQTVQFELGKDQEIGIHAETGELAWTQKGVSSACAIGSRPLAAEPLDPEASWLPATPVRCRIEGTETRGLDGWSRELTQLSLEGFDPSTGVARWTVDVAESDGDRLMSAHLAADQHDVLVRGGRVVLTAEGERRLVTFDDGVAHEIPEGFAFLCKGRGDGPTVEYATPFANDSASARVSPFPYVCDADGEPTSSQLTKGAVEAGAIEVGSGRHVYATEEGVFGYDFA